MYEERKRTTGEPNRLARAGLKILYAKPGPKDNLANVAKRDLTGELRERYWIRQAADAGIAAKTWASVGIGIQWPIERAELGRNRNEPGDGFRYVFRSGTGGTGGRAEWFEVTEVFEGVEAKDIEAFMRLENGGEGYPDFDQQRFLRGLNLGMPLRATQRRAADKVIAAVERKLAKSSYEGLWRLHGYGTLIVGLPLWFATYPLDPLRVENVVDDFTTRVQLGLESHARQLRKRSCPFWRIVVVWNGSVESMRDWTSKARLDVYKDPAYRRMGALPVGGGSMIPLLLDLLDVVEGSDQARPDGDGFAGFTMYLAATRAGKREQKQDLHLPPALAEWTRQLHEFAESHREGFRARIKLHAKLRILEVLCFVRAYGLGGLERWVIARLSPRRWIAHRAMRWRALRLYRVSRWRQRPSPAARPGPRSPP